MRGLREWFRRVYRILRPGRHDGDLEDELRSHVELATEDARRRGFGPEDAYRVARLQSGGMAQALDALRDQRGLPALHDALQDLRYACRTMHRAPGFTALVALTLGVGLGATGTVFSAIDAVLLRPLSVAAPDELFVLRQAGQPRTRFPPPFERSLNESGTVFAQTLGSFTFPVTVVASGEGSRARAAFVTPNYFSLLGVRPFLGRLFSRDEGRDGAVISHQFWRERFGGRSSAIGEILRVGDATLVIVGVAPASFGGLQVDVPLDLWLPTSVAPAAVPIPSFRPSVDVVGRLAPGVSPDVGASRVTVEHKQWLASLSSGPPAAGAAPLVLRPASHGLESGVRETFRASLRLLTAICVCLWMTTIVNVSGLLSARLRERSQEVAIRQALGATSRRLWMQRISELTVVMFVGLGLGLLITAGLSAAIPRWIPAWAGVAMHVSPLVLAAAVITAAVAALVIAVVQGVDVSRHSMNPLAPGSVDQAVRRRRTLSRCMVPVQLALTLPLLVMSCLLAQSLYHLSNSDAGFARSHLLQMSVEPVLVGYSPERAGAYYAALIERLRTVPGIAGASISSGGALSGYDGVGRIRDTSDWHEVTTNAVDERYFGTLGIRLAAGRSFDEVEAREDAPLVVINEALARRLFGRSDRALEHVLTVAVGRTEEQRTVIGVVDNTADTSPRSRSTPSAYLPVGDSTLLMVHIRTVADSASMVAAARRTATELDPTVPILGLETIEGRRYESLQRERLLAVASAGVGWVALLVTAVGVFGRVSQEVVARTREIVIRSALGATRSQIRSLFLRGTARTLVLSGVFGVGASIAAARLVQKFLYGVAPTGVLAYIVAASALIGVATMATMLPLRRAWRTGASTQLLRE